MGDARSETIRRVLVVPHAIVVQGERDLGAAPSLVDSKRPNYVRDQETGVVKRAVGGSAGSQNWEKSGAEGTTNCARRASLLEVSHRMGEEGVVLNCNVCR